MREGEKLKAPRHASAAATRNGNLPLRDGKLPYVMVICLISNNLIKVIKVRGLFIYYNLALRAIY